MPAVSEEAEDDPDWCPSEPDELDREGDSPEPAPDRPADHPQPFVCTSPGCELKSVNSAH